jgi:hypothetical protein
VVTQSVTPVLVPPVGLRSVPIVLRIHVELEHRLPIHPAAPSAVPGAAVRRGKLTELVVQPVR